MNKDLQELTGAITLVEKIKKDIEKRTGVHFIPIVNRVHVYKGIEKLINPNDLELSEREDNEYPYELSYKIGKILIFQIFKHNEIIVKGNEWEVVE